MILVKTSKDPPVISSLVRKTMLLYADLSGRLAHRGFGRIDRPKNSIWNVSAVMVDASGRVLLELLQ
jgi:hypothetical protein